MTALSCCCEPRIEVFENLLALSSFCLPVTFDKNVMLGDKFVYMLHETVILLFSSNTSSLTLGSTENKDL